MNAEAVEETVLSIKNDSIQLIHNSQKIEISMDDFMHTRTHNEFGTKFNNKVLGNHLILIQTAYKLHKNMTVDAEYAAVL